MFKRLLCSLLGHRDRKVPREDGESGFQMRCSRCGRE